MEKLKQAQLYGNELIPVSGKLVERYNKCLKTLGLAPTKLSSFSIDGVGWSPEVSEEKSRLHYLSNGEANQHGIIISPLQSNKPVFVPFHSFDRAMMKLVFKTYGNQINDITRDSAICIDFDQGIDAFYEPMDVLKYKNVTIRFRLIDDLEKIQQKQLQLIDTFKQGHNFIDENLHQTLLKSAKTYGDLRGRDLHLNPIKFTTDSFFTEAFGGVYVLRDFVQDIVVFEDEKWHKEAIKNTTYNVLLYHISQPELVKKLRDYVIIEANLERAVNTPRYNRIKTAFFVELLQEPAHPIKDILDNEFLFKKYLNKMDIASLKRINGVELYLERLARNNTYKIRDMVDTEMYTALHRPHSSLEPKHQDLIWKLLVNIAPKDVLFLYWYDKMRFYDTYKTWDESYREWVVEEIRNNI